RPRLGFRIGFGGSLILRGGFGCRGGESPGRVADVLHDRAVELFLAQREVVVDGHRFDVEGVAEPAHGEAAQAHAVDDAESLGDDPFPAETSVVATHTAILDLLRKVRCGWRSGVGNRTTAAL